MIDENTMRSMLENMERAAEESLQQDSAFHEALQALKWEIDSDPQVQLTISHLQAAGQRVFSSFVPRIKVRVKTEGRVFALPRLSEILAPLVAEQVRRLTRDLRDATSAVVNKSRYCHELDSIVHEAVGTSNRFEGIASEVESAGYQVLISLDLSGYSQVQGAATPLLQVREANAQVPHKGPVPIQLSATDRKFLKGLNISAEDS